MTSDYSTMTNENGNNEENEYDDGNRGGNWQFMSFLLWAMITTMLVAMMFVDSGIFLFSARFFFCLFVWESRKNKRRHFPPLPPPPPFPHLIPVPSVTRFSFCSSLPLSQVRPIPYKYGSRGPEEANALFARNGFKYTGRYRWNAGGSREGSVSK